MKLTQNHIEHLTDQVQRGVITAEEANVEKVRIARVQVVTGRLSAPVRKALNAAVKRGYLGHWKREGRKPEVYFHPTFEYLAREARDKHERKVAYALKGVLSHE